MGFLNSDEPSDDEPTQFESLVIRIIDHAFRWALFRRSSLWCFSHLTRPAPSEGVVAI